jgi:hypothetical protein
MFRGHPNDVTVLGEGDLEVWDAQLILREEWNVTWGVFEKVDFYRDIIYG